MSVSRLYLPAECDAGGVPLDWERCRTCEGEGCPTCGGHGSLKAAALVRAKDRSWFAGGGPENFRAGNGPALAEWEPRCEGCSHPLSEGTWEPPRLPRWPTAAGSLSAATALLKEGCEPQVMRSTLFSRCDERCEHGGPGRVYLDPEWVYQDVPARLVPGHVPTEASWRQVDVRCLSWAHDLRPEFLAVLCTRCEAERTNA